MIDMSNIEIRRVRGKWGENMKKLVRIYVRLFLVSDYLLRIGIAENNTIQIPGARTKMHFFT